MRKKRSAKIGPSKHDSKNGTGNRIHNLLRTKKNIFTVPFWNRLVVPKIGPQNRQISREGQIWNRGGPHMRNLISINFLAPKMEPESVYVLSPFIGSNMVIAMEYDPGKIQY